MRVLAYPIAKAIKGDKKLCKEAYFGWIKFEAPTEAIEGFKKEIEVQENLIRSLIVKTVRENTLYGPKFLKDKEMKREKKEGEEKDEPKGEINEVELDKSIDSLVV